VTLPDQGGAQPRRLALDLPATHSAVRLARRVARDFARMDGMASREVENLMLVVSELLGNAVDHGGGGSAMEEKDLEGSVRMSLRMASGDRSWELEVDDQGGGDVEEVRGLLDPDGLPDLEDERGRGFFLLAQMVDVMEVRPSADGKGLTISARHAHARP